MLRILGSRKKLCDGLTRRDVLQVGTLGFLGLADWLRFREAQAAVESAPGFGQAKSCILLFLFGSPSQHDTFDPKPEAPEEVRGELKPIATRVPGMQICELLPQIAGRVSDRITLVRSLSHPHPIHSVAYAITGTPTIDIPMQLNPKDGRHWPFIGSVVDYLDERRKREAKVPRNICLPWLLSSRREGSSRDAGPYGHFLGPTWDPLWIEFEGEGADIPYYYRLGMENPPRNPFAGVVPDQCRFPLAGAGALPAGVTLGRLHERQELLRRFDTACRSLEQHDAMRHFDHHQQRALSLMTSSRTSEALDISHERPAMREKYGMHLFGQAVLAARRLVEAGARFVTVFWDDFYESANAWDTHYAHYPNMRNASAPAWTRQWRHWWRTWTTAACSGRRRSLASASMAGARG